MREINFDVSRLVAARRQIVSGNGTTEPGSRSGGGVHIRDFMQRRLFQTSRHSSHQVECGDWPVPWKLCRTSSICVLFSTLALMRRAPQTPCIKSLLGGGQTPTVESKPNKSNCELSCICGAQWRWCWCPRSEGPRTHGPLEPAGTFTAASRFLCKSSVAARKLELRRQRGQSDLLMGGRSASGGHARSSLKSQSASESTVWKRTLFFRLRSSCTHDACNVEQVGLWSVVIAKAMDSFRSDTDT